MNKLTTQQSILTRIAAVAVTGLALCFRPVSAQDYAALPQAECVEPASDPSWSLFWSKSKAIRYGSALTHCTRLHQRNMPVCPPICHPSFGYHNPCWRQIPVDRRCQPCDIIRDGWSTETLPLLPSPSSMIEAPPAPHLELPSPTPDRKPLTQYEPAKY